MAGNAAAGFAFLCEYRRSSHSGKTAPGPAENTSPLRITFQRTFTNRNTGMNDTVEQLMIWGSLGIGVGLFASDHKHLGIAVAAVAPTTVAILHPRGTGRALKAV